jgi:arsenical pump membrane protein
VLLLTPPIVGLIRRCYPHRPDLVAPFAFAIFSAAGVAPLVISNPMNMIVAYAAVMTPIALAGWVTTYFILRTIFRRELRLIGGADARAIAAPRLSLPARQFLAVMVIRYPTAVAVGSATGGLLLCWQHRVASPQHVAVGLSWEILIFLFGVFVIVLGLQHVGVVGLITEVYTSAIGSATQVVVIAISSALGSAVINNHPMAILGPRLLPVGSLAGLLWLDSLQRQGIRIDLSQFVLVGAAVTFPTLALSLTILLLGMR